MKWTGLMEQNGQVTRQEGEVADPYRDMALAAKQSGLPTARIRAVVGRTLEMQGEWPKCSFEVELECPQEKQWMDHAADYCYTAAERYVHHGLARLLAPPDTPQT